MRMAQRALAMGLSLLLLGGLCACGQEESVSGSAESVTQTAETSPQPESESGSQPEAEPVSDKQTVQPSVDPATLVPYDGVVEHLFFHPAIAYPELAFDGDAQSDGFDDWMVTVDEYQKILQSLYENDYVLVDINSVWSEQTENGSAKMVPNVLMVPEGKKPLVLSFDDVNYYEYMRENGFPYKLVLGEDGELWSWGIDPQGNEVLSQDLDVVTILDKFVEEHPDFSPFGAKGCLSLTGYEGILGYRTNTTTQGLTAEQEVFRQQEMEAVRPIVERLKETGWTFGCHTWGHINLSKRSLALLQEDMERWNSDVGSLVGETQVIFYPHGARPDGDDVNQTGEMFAWLQGEGYRIFCSVGISSYSKCKSDISAVICDRMHPDGTTLRSAKGRERYLKFYDAKDIINLEVRPERAVGWQSE